MTESPMHFKGSDQKEIPSFHFFFSSVYFKFRHLHFQQMLGLLQTVRQTLSDLICLETRKPLSSCVAPVAGNKRKPPLKATRAESNFVWYPNADRKGRFIMLLFVVTMRFSKAEQCHIKWQSCHKYFSWSFQWAFHAWSEATSAYFQKLRSNLTCS